MKLGEKYIVHNPWHESLKVGDVVTVIKVTDGTAYLDRKNPESGEPWNANLSNPVDAWIKLSKESKVESILKQIDEL